MACPLCRAGTVAGETVCAHCGKQVARVLPATPERRDGAQFRIIIYMVAGLWGFLGALLIIASILRSSF